MNTKWKTILRKSALLAALSFVIGFTAASIATNCLRDYSVTVGDTSSDRTPQSENDED